MTAERVPIVVLTVLAIGAGAAWFVLSERSPEPLATAAPVEITEPPPPPPPPAAAAVAPPKPEPEETSGMLLLPDGSKVAPLNGVVNPPRLVWQNPEWSPIVRTEHSNGWDWYVHADGSYSTTVMMWREDLQRTDAMSYVLHPLEAKPVRPLPPDGAVRPDGPTPQAEGTNRKNER